MNEKLPGNDRRRAPPPPVSAPPAATARSSGSLIAGVGLAWLIEVVGHVLAAMIPTASAQVLPEIAVIVCGTALILRGKTGTGKGVFIGLATVVGVVILLVAACFGMLASSNYH